MKGIKEGLQNIIQILQSIQNEREGKNCQKLNIIDRRRNNLNVRKTYCEQRNNDNFNNQSIYNYYDLWEKFNSVYTRPNYTLFPNQLALAAINLSPITPYRGESLQLHSTKYRNPHQMVVKILQQLQCPGSCFVKVRSSNSVETSLPSDHEVPGSILGFALELFTGGELFHVMYELG